jgi:hypothetical protein
MSKSLIIWGVLYLMLLVLVSWAMLRARGDLIRTYQTDEQQAAWDQWREEVQRQTQGEGPVLRRPPGSDEPPGLVLMRDHFPSMMGGALLMSSVLFFAFAFLVQGMISSKHS